MFPFSIIVYAINNENPIDGRYKFLSANTNPTLKNKFDEGRKDTKNKTLDTKIIL